VASLGGDAELAAESFARSARLRGATGDVEWWPLVGVEQETAQSLTLADGVVTTHAYACEPGGRVDRRGDGTVYRDAAGLPGTRPMHVPQTHGALAARAEGIAHACAVVTARSTGPWLAGEAHVGLAVPDVVTAGEPFEVRVTGDVRAGALTVGVVDTRTQRPVARPWPRPRDGELVAAAVLPGEGLYRVEAKAGGLSPVTELVLGVRP
jgi:hypothetical protein